MQKNFIRNEVLIINVTNFIIITLSMEKLPWQKFQIQIMQKRLLLDLNMI